MWLFTTDGFYSVVHDKYCKPDELMVRARKREDLENLFAHKITGEILEIGHADYRFRMAVKRKIWSKYLAGYANKMAYSNFKGTLPLNDHARHDAYFKCWSAMYAMTDDVGNEA